VIGVSEVTTGNWPISVITYMYLMTLTKNTASDLLISIQIATDSNPKLHRNTK